MDISEITRRDIIDLFVVGIENPDDPLYNSRLLWSGRMDDEQFLSRLYDLKNMPSTDWRFKNAYEDIRQHCTNNSDWDNDWVFYDSRFDLLHAPDDAFLKFLCEMFHPAVRSERQDWERFLEQINTLLLPDGFRIVEVEKISGRSVYGWEKMGGQNGIIDSQAKEIDEKFDSKYITSQIQIMKDSIENAPNVAIGKAKELLETCCKTILDEMEVLYSAEIDLTQLMKITCDAIGLSAKGADRSSNSGIIAAKILGNLGVISQGMAELRNLYGDGHGRTKGFKQLPKRYANLAVGASVTAVNFMWDTYVEKYKSSLLKNENT